MKTVFCIDDNPKYLILAKVAVRSLRRLYGDDVPVLCVYGGRDQSIIDAVTAENVPLALHTPILNRDVVPKKFHRAIGAFLKLELSLLPELADDPYVLYSDSDMFFHQPFDELLAMNPPYMAMAREQTAPFFHEYEQLQYTFKNRDYTVPMPFPIWTFSSGVVVFNLDRLRRLEYIHNFLAFCAQNLDKIGNLDQSLLNYFFGKRITKLQQEYNCPPYMAQSMADGKLIHFHGPKPWETTRPLWKDLRVNHFDAFRAKWFALLTEEERAEVNSWPT